MINVSSPSGSFSCRNPHVVRPTMEREGKRMAGAWDTNELLQLRRPWNSLLYSIFTVSSSTTCVHPSNQLPICSISYSNCTPATLGVTSLLQQFTLQYQYHTFQLLPRSFSRSRPSCALGNSTNADSPPHQRLLFSSTLPSLWLSTGTQQKLKPCLLVHLR